MKLQNIIVLMVTHVVVMYFDAASSVSSSSTESDDYYDILGISRDAEQKQIKRAFHKMATIYHPDKNDAEGTEEKFRQVAEAYEVLSDPEKRRKYDRFGKAAFQSGSSSESRGGGFTFASFDEMFKHFDDPFGDDDPFHYSFGGNDFDGMGEGFDSDSFANFGFGEQFGDGESFFGTHFGNSDSHFQESQSRRMRNTNDGSYSESSSRSGGRSCQTITQRIGNMVTTFTRCS